ncbi:MAG: cell wall-binding protein, partial [Johnsonella sp.]|nr:cell wall-binding protein [Johnsonella sp.]
WINDNMGWWFKNPDGSWPKNTWREISYNAKKDWYFFNQSGYMNTGWLTWNGNWYYLNENSDQNVIKGSMAKGWQMINGKWYYFYEKTEGNNPAGSMAKSIVIQGYSINEDGVWVK